MKWKSILFSVPISTLIFMAIGKVLNGRLERKVLLLVMCSNTHTHVLAWQEYWSGLPIPTPGIFPPQGSDLRLLHPLHWQADLYHCTCRLGSPSVQHMLPYKVNEHARAKAFLCGHIFIELFSFWNSQSKDFFCCFLNFLVHFKKHAWLGDQYAAIWFLIIKFGIQIITLIILFVFTCFEWKMSLGKISLFLFYY